MDRNLIRMTGCEDFYEKWRNLNDGVIDPSEEVLGRGTGDKS